MKIDLEIGSVKHIPELSFYNNNYYKMGNMNPFLEADVIYECCHEDENRWTYELGYIHNNKFVLLVSFDVDGFDSILTIDEDEFALKSYGF